MRFLSLSLLLVTMTRHTSGQDDVEGAMKYALDGMQELMEGQGDFDEDSYSSFVSCFDDLDPGMMAAQDSMWMGMMEYAGTNGGDDDRWRDCEYVSDLEEHEYVEWNCTLQEQGEIPVYEPCNYASNVAYYHSMLEVCMTDGWAMPEEYVVSLGQCFGYLAHGSAFFHASRTSLGHEADIRLNDLFSFIVHQASVSHLEPLNSSVLHDLSPTPRSKTAFETTEELQEIFTTRPVDEWEEALASMDVPGVRLGVCAFLSTAMDLLIESDNTVDTIVALLLNLLGVEGYDAEFCLDSYLPELHAATESIELDQETRERLARGLVGTLIKEFYAVLWQETMLTADVLFTEEANELGYTLLPTVNALANAILPSDDFPHYSQDFQDGVGVYPGEGWCNVAALPHAKWHLETGVALSDMGRLADLMYQAILTQEEPQQDGDPDAAVAVTSNWLLLFTVSSAFAASFAAQRT